jgi:hypothetical protein
MVNQAMNPSSRASRIPDLLSAVAISLVLTAIIYLFLTSRADIRDGNDNAIYMAMAENPSTYYLYPFRSRILTPIVVHFLPVELKVGFTILTFVSLNLTAIMLFLFMRRLGLSRTSSLLMLSVYLFSWGPVHSLTNPFLSDPLTYLFLVSGFYLLLFGTSDLAFAVITFCGALNRETSLFLIPSYFYFRKQSSRLTALVRTLLIAIPSVAAIAYLGFGPQSSSVTWTSNYLNPSSIVRIIQHHIAKNALFDVYSTFGVVWVLSVLNIDKAASRLFRPNTLFITLVLLQLLIATDEARMLSFLFPLLIPLGAYEFERTLQRFPSGYNRIVLLVTLVLGEIASLVNWRWILIPDRYLRYLLVVLGILTTLAVASINRKSQLCHIIQRVCKS